MNTQTPELLNHLNAAKADIEAAIATFDATEPDPSPDLGVFTYYDLSPYAPAQQVIFATRSWFVPPERRAEDRYSVEWDAEYMRVAFPQTLKGRTNMPIVLDLEPVPLVDEWDEIIAVVREIDPSLWIGVYGIPRRPGNKLWTDDAWDAYHDAAHIETLALAEHADWINIHAYDFYVDANTPPGGVLRVHEHGLVNHTRSACMAAATASVPVIFSVSQRTYGKQANPKLPVSECRRDWQEMWDIAGQYDVPRGFILWAMPSRAPEIVAPDADGDSYWKALNEIAGVAVEGVER